MKTLVLYASPIDKEISISTKATNKYLELLGNEDIKKVDLNLLPEFQSSLTSERFANGDFFQNGSSQKWIDELFDTDLLIISTSMINFNVPAVLKNFIDSIAVANKTFK